MTFDLLASARLRWRPLASSGIDPGCGDIVETEVAPCGCHSTIAIISPRVA